MSATVSMSLREAGRRVRAHLLWVRWLDALRRSGVFLFAGCTAGVLALRLGGVRWIGLADGIAALVLWGLAALAWVWLRRPSPVAALALWDERTERDEMFVSAWCFETGGHPDEGERLHLARSLAALPSEIGRLGRHFPPRFPLTACAAAAMFLAVTGSDLLMRSLPVEELPLTDEARLRASEVAGALSEDAENLEGSEALTEEERRELEDLKSSLARAAEKLRDLSGETPRDVLEELEQRAREAEKLAEALSGEAAAELSSDMLAELERHADTAGLAAALRAKDLEQIANEADKLAERLRNENLSVQEANRIENALREALKRATESDRRSVVGRHMNRAHENLRQGERNQAADRFQRLSRHFRRLQQRSNTRQHVRGLAQRLRNSGQQIFGQTPMGLRRLAPQPPPGTRQLRPGQGLGFQLQPFRQQPGGQGRPGLALVPRPGRSGAPRHGMNLPMPGSGSGRQPGATIPGGGDPGGTMPGAGGGNTPVPGTSSGQTYSPGSTAGVGGLEAGHGTAPYGNTATRPFESTGTGVVNATPGEEGPSSVRLRPGAAHGENAARSAQELAVEFLQAQEAALNEQPLPLSRREQVLRYFTALRRQIQDGE